MKYTLEHPHTRSRLVEKYETRLEAMKQANQIYQDTGTLYAVVEDNLIATPYTDTATDAQKVSDILNTMGYTTKSVPGAIAIDKEGYTSEVGVLLEAAGYRITQGAA